MNLEIAHCRSVPDPSNQARPAPGNRGEYACIQRNNGFSKQLAIIELKLRPTPKPPD